MRFTTTDRRRFAGRTSRFGGRALLLLFVLGVLAGVTVGVLLFIRRISMKSYVPYGPFLIAGILWAILGLPQT